MQRHFWKALLSYLKSKSQYTVLLYVRLDKQLVSHHSWHGCAMWSDVWRDVSEHQKAVAKPPLHDCKPKIYAGYSVITRQHDFCSPASPEHNHNLKICSSCNMCLWLTPAMNIILSWWSDKSSKFQTHSWRPEIPATLCYGFFWSNCYNFRCNILFTAKYTIFLPSHASNQVIRWDR